MFPGTREALRRTAITEQHDRRGFYVLVFAAFTAFVGFSNVAPLLPLYILTLDVESLHDAALWGGVILGISPLISAIVAPFWGMFGDRFGHKLVVQRSLYGFTVLFIPMAFATSIWHLFWLRALIGFFGGFQAQSIALATILVPRRQLAQAIGAIQLAQILGSAIGPVLGGFVGDRFGFAGAIPTGAALNGIAAIAVTLFLRETRRQPRDAVEARPPGPGLFALAGFVPMLLALVLIRLLERTFDPLIPLLVVKIEPNVEGAASLAGLIIGLGTLATAASAGLAGRLGDRIDSARLLQAGLLAGAVISLPFIFVNSPWQILALRLCLGLAVGGAVTLAFSFAGRNLPPERRGLAFGLLGSAVLYGNGIGAMGSGSLASLSFQFPFIAAAGLYLVAVGIVDVAIRQRASAGAPAAIPTAPQ